MRTVKLTLAYDGAGFVGWQRQARGTSIQGLVEAALTRVTGAGVTVTGAGRTDAGVHALGQVASARVPAAVDVATLWRALNALLPPEVRVVGLEEAGDGFHARHAARSKRYVYRLVTTTVLSPFERRYAWHVTPPLDRRAIESALDPIHGTHDFAAFQATGSRVRDTVRTLYDARIVEGSEVQGFKGSEVPRFRGSGLDPLAAARAPMVFTFHGDGFLRHMVRNLVGTLVEIGRGRWPPGYMDQLLASRDRRRAGPTAPPQGLFLVGVDY